MLNTNRAYVFAALGDPLRLQLLVHIGNGESITRLASEFSLTRQAVTHHLRLLEQARLIESRKSGREVQFFSRPERLEEVKGWLDEVAMQWDGTLGRLKTHVEGKRENK